MIVIRFLKVSKTIVFFQKPNDRFWKRLKNESKNDRILTINNPRLVTPWTWILPDFNCLVFIVTLNIYI